MRNKLLLVCLPPLALSLSLLLCAAALRLLGITGPQLYGLTWALMGSLAIFMLLLALIVFLPQR